MHKIILLLTFFLSTPSLFSQQKSEPSNEIDKITAILFGGTVENLKKETKLPLIDYKANHLLFCNVVINEKTYLFLYDTGATITLVSEEIGKNEVVKGTISLKDGYDKKKEGSLITKDIYLNTICFKNTGCVVVDLQSLRKKSCLPIDGIIGDNLIQLCNWKINPIEESIYFSDIPFTAPSNSKTMDLEFYSKSIPLVNLSIDNSPFWASIDTGFSGSFSLNEAYFFKLKKSKKIDLKSGYGNYFTTIGDNTEHKIYEGTLDTIYAGKAQLTNVKTVIDIGKPSVGIKFFRDYITVFNFKEKKLLLTSIDTTTKVDDSEFNLNFGFNEQNELVVQFLWDDSEIKKQNIKIGDQIISINGINCEMIDLEKYCDIRHELKKSTTLYLTLKRNSKTFDVLVNKKE
jgi:hypothetical protein